MQLTTHHFSDSEGNPAGGNAYGRGFAIAWQNGPLGRGPDRQEPNGAFVEDIIAAARDRLEFYQKGKFACDENQVAIDHLTGALQQLNKRSMSRVERNIEGTHEA